MRVLSKPQKSLLQPEPSNKNDMLHPCRLSLLILLLAALFGPTHTAAFVTCLKSSSFRPIDLDRSLHCRSLSLSRIPSKNTNQFFTKMTAASNDSNADNDKVLLEVEQKFAILDNANLTAIEETLSQLGMEKKGQVVHMVDWYYDVPAPHWVLTPQDCWLRYREVSSEGSWQLKRGRQHEGGATVYEEIEGPPAIQACLDMLARESDINISSPPVLNDDEFDGYYVPQIPAEYGDTMLVPFARIATRRSSWSIRKGDENSPHQGLTVDLDGTNFGYMVGEVEAVVSDAKDISNTRQRIEELILRLTPHEQSSDDSGAAVGKLEYFLMTQKPNHYKACVQNGSIVPERGSSQAPNGLKN